MLNAIDYQLCHDENRQREYESALAPVMLQHNKANLQAFYQYSPELAKVLESYHPERFSPFITRAKELNITYVMRARALYSMTPQAQVTQQLTDFKAGALCIDKRQQFAVIQPQLTAGGSIEQIYPGIGARYQPVESQQQGSLMILGCGLGLHLLDLAQAGQWSSILLVEPEFDLLKVSLLSASWAEFFRYCSDHQIDVEILTGSADDENLVAIGEWMAKQPEPQLFLYRHYQYPLFNRLELALVLGEISWENVPQLQFNESLEMRHFEFGFSLSHYLDKKAPTVLNSQRFDRNLQAFSELLPDVARSFADYQPRRWVLIVREDGQINLLDSEQGTMLYLDDGRQESLAYCEYYQHHPKLDKLDARTGTRKASPYVHYEYSDKLKELVQELPDESFAKLPEKLPSFLLYGLGAGYQLEKLNAEHQIDNLIVYEPNADYFYASLFLLDWVKILDKLNQANANLYLNIGDDGEHMAEDILGRLNYSGMHILSYTFFYVSYYQRSFDQHIRHTREHFRVLLNISEYYDHAFYNWSHTLESLKNNRPYLLKQRSDKYQQTVAELPVFVVGNGPSLDYSVEVLREYQDRAIIISCGTSLKALYKYGIRPDFHAEVEQTRSTYHWICQVPDKEWLKQIDLLTVNGVHPDVSSLFRQTLLCFKKGEAATLAALLAEPTASNYEDILYAYPTVSNCAIAYTLALGFKQIYLFGVDLGFKDPRYHHSQQSAYFKEQDGQEIYDYSQHGVGLQVPGNFDPQVFTKYEFRYSAEIISKTLGLFHQVDCYNTSDGAYIDGTIPLSLENLLILNPPIDKPKLRQFILDEAYDCHTEQLAHTLQQWFDDSLMDGFFEPLLKLAKQPCESWEQVLAVQNQQMAVLAQAAYQSHSLFFMLMRGSITFALTYLIRLAFSCDDEAVGMQWYAKGQQVWIDYINAIQTHQNSRESDFDQTPGLNF